MALFNTDSFTLTGLGEAAHIQGAIVSADLFSLLGVRPVLGRTFLPEEDKLNATSGGFPIILSHRLWRASALAPTLELWAGSSNSTTGALRWSA
jgi:putative ABC transport system permease protein